MKCGDPLRAGFPHPMVVAGLWFLLLPMLVALVGCGPSSGTVPVKGKVTYQGKPVTRGRITFEPIKLADSRAPVRPSMAPIQQDGSFKMSTFESGDGVQPGEYKVIIWAVENEPGDDDWGKIGSTFELGWLVPEKYGYSTSTPLTVTVPSQGDLLLDLSD
jgi:hypothetical protein